MTTKAGTKKTDERRLWFKHQLELRGTSFAAIARRLGVSRQAVRKSILNPSPRVAEAVAAELGIECATLWPDRYPAGKE